MRDKDLSGDPTRELPFAHGGPPLAGSLRVQPEDFVVTEELGYTASGAGEHVFLTVRKRGRNTHEVARAIARLAGVPQMAVGYAGLKDRHAVTTQHFTVQLPGKKAPDWRALEDDSLEVLGSTPHHRKIRRGGLRGNRFELRIRGIAGDRDQAEGLLRRISRYGVPNYFGGQRFGRQGSNLSRVEALFAGEGRKPGREQRGLLLSAARAQLFNQVLAARVAAGNWDRALDGDVMMLAGAQRQFMHDPDDPTIAERLARLDVHPSGPLCGRPSRALASDGEAGAVEQSALADWQAWITGLARMGLDADRRALRLAVADLHWHWQSDDLLLAFGLSAGSYATMLVRELLAEPDQRL
jgi:tRNA pseudouridine13 synthase